jgi:uncharacterized membrane protein
VEALYPYVLDWLNFLVRWLHLVAGIAWIGSSFYFVWLDNHLREPDPELKAKGVAGELWAVHGGGFYNPQKYLVAPATLPAELHWFKWEAYTTWLSGFGLLVIVYYANAQAMMVDPQVAKLSSAAAIGVSLASLVIGWVVYDLACRSPLGARPVPFGIVLFVFMLLAAWVLAHLLGGRAAYIQVGAMIGTIMAANVLMVIIPGQRRMVEAMRAGRAPDPLDGRRGKQRSVHNNYLTLPVLLIMISNHYAMFTHHPHNWAVLGALSAAGVLIRQFFNLRHKGKTDWRWPAAGCVVLAAVAVWLAPPLAAPAAKVSPADVKHIVDARCVACHAAKPTFPGFAAAPAGVMLESPAQIKQNAQKIYQQVVQTRAMPIGNLTQITEEERAKIAAWFGAGAPVD